ncbi:MAG: acyl carrier protein [Alphaproteobacteria bacterium]|nr:acyl carrier protein [Alphaproteobacteria bacterium]
MNTTTMMISMQQVRNGLAATTGQDVADIAVDEDFCEVLGLDSLDRLELLSKLEDAFGVLLLDSQVRDIRSLEDLTVAVNQAAGDGAWRGRS